MASNQPRQNIIMMCAYLLLSSCDKPIGDISQLDGCYFANGEQSVFRVFQSKLVAPNALSIVSITSSTSDASVISFNPGIRVTVDEHKSMIVVQGSDVRGLTFERLNKRYILLPGGGIPVELIQRQCVSR